MSFFQKYLDTILYQTIKHDSYMSQVHKVGT